MPDEEARQRVGRRALRGLLAAPRCSSGSGGDEPLVTGLVAGPTKVSHKRAEPETNRVHLSSRVITHASRSGSSSNGDLLWSRTRSSSASPWGTVPPWIGAPIKQTTLPTAAEADAAVRASPEDLALVKRLIGGDDAAFTDLIERHHGSLVRLAMVFVSNPATAEEIAQETWTAVLTGLGSFEGRPALKSWIFRILTNRAKTRAVRDGRSIPFSALGTEVHEPSVDPARFDTA